LEALTGAVLDDELHISGHFVRQETFFIGPGSDSNPNESIRCELLLYMQVSAYRSKTEVHDSRRPDPYR